MAFYFTVHNEYRFVDTGDSIALMLTTGIVGFCVLLALVLQRKVDINTSFSLRFYIVFAGIVSAPFASVFMLAVLTGPPDLSWVLAFVDVSGTLVSVSLGLLFASGSRAWNDLGAGWGWAWAWPNALLSASVGVIPGTVRWTFAPNDVHVSRLLFSALTYGVLGLLIPRTYRRVALAVMETHKSAVSSTPSGRRGSARRKPTQ